MKTKTLIELMSLSANLFLISQDEKMMNKLSGIAKKGKDTLNDIFDNVSEGNEETLIEKLREKAKQAKEELDHRIAETVEVMYEKMKIAHTNQIGELKVQIDNLRKELALAEARILSMESRK